MIFSINNPVYRWQFTKWQFKLRQLWPMPLSSKVGWTHSNSIKSSKTVATFSTFVLLNSIDQFVASSSLVALQEVCQDDFTNSSVGMKGVTKLSRWSQKMATAVERFGARKGAKTRDAAPPWKKQKLKKLGVWQTNVLMTLTSGSFRQPICQL